MLFLAMSGIRFMALRLEWISGRADFISAARWALSLSLYGGILLGLVYAVLQRVFAPAAILCIFLLSLGFVTGIGRGLENLSNLPATRDRSLGGPGLILANPGIAQGTAVVLLRGPGEPAAARVLAVPGSPMVFQEEFAGMDHSLVTMPAAPFNSGTPWFLQSIAADLRLSAENLYRRLGEGLPSFLLYAGSLVFLLTSFMFVFRLGAWPMANLFLGLPAFRGVLALETFFNANEIQEVFGSFFQGRLSVSLVVPGIFLIVGALAHLYSVLAHLARRQVRNAAA